MSNLEYEKPINLEIDTKLYVPIVAKQYDNSRYLLFRILNNGVPFSLENKTIRVYGIKPDGNQVFNDLEVINATEGIARLQLTEQMLAASGTLNVELKIFQEANLLTTTPFSIEVSKPLMKVASVTSSNEFGTLINALDKAEQYGEELKGATGNIELMYAEELNGLGTQLSDVVQGRFGRKKYVAVGDSITVGFVDNPYATLVGKAMDMDVVNMGGSGSAITVVNGRTDSIYERRANIPTDADIISIFGGTNDFGHNSPMGASGSTSFYEFYGAYSKLISWVLENRPNSTVFAITPLHRESENTANTEGYILEDYVNVIRDICDYYSIPLLDLWSNSSFNLAIPAHRKIYSNDGLHPIQNGHDIMAQKIIDFIRGL